MSIIGFRNTTKYMLPTLISLMLLLTAFAGINVTPVKAFEFTLYATTTNNPDWGYYGGYHAIWDQIKIDLAAIGINLIRQGFDDFTWYGRVFDAGWNKTHLEGGWDLTMNEWWLQPHAPDPWFTSMVRGDLTPYEDGYNIAPWRDADADTLLTTGMTSFDANTRKTYLWAWQEEFMRDPPWINVYYPKIFDIIASWVTGYDPSGTWFYDLAALNLDSAALAAAKPLRDPNTLIFAVSEELWSLSPMFMDTYTDEQVATMCYNQLYKWSVDPFPVWPNPPGWEDYVIKPDMAAALPTYLDGGTRVRVPLRSGMVWRYKNGTTVPITAYDVKWTYDAMMDPTSKSTGLADFTHVIDSVTVVNSLTVDFNLKYAYPDILSVLANDWGTGAILPSHLLNGTAYPQLKNHAGNWDFSHPANWMPVSGPFIWDEIVPGDHVTLVKNPSYYGYGLGWGPYNVDTFILQWVPNPADRLAKYLASDIDFGEYPTAPVATFKSLNNTGTYPNIRVWQYDYPASNTIWINFDNEYLSNRYVRLAIAHAINYDYIINNLLDSWGIETAYRGKTYILPQHYYDDGVTEVHLFNEDLLPYDYNVTKAQAYMDLWKGSQTGHLPYTDGPVGDADFSGTADMDDFFLWRDEGWGQTMPIPFLPGQDKDPDFDNTGFIEMADFFRWRANWGATYP